MPANTALRYLTLAMAIAAGLFVMVVGARLLIAGPAGRALIVTFVDDTEFGSAGRASLQGLQGDVLSGFTIDRFSLSDPSGEWLVVENAAMDWRPLRYLLSGRLTVLSLTADRVAVLRKPPASQSSGGGGSIPSVVVGRLAIDAVELAEGVIGPAATVQIASALESRDDGSISLNARLERTDEAGDFATLAVARDAQGHITSEVEARGTAGGPLASLLRAPDSRIDLTASIRGTMAAGTGDGILQFDGVSVARFETDWGDERLTARADVDAPQWPLELVRRYVGGEAHLEMDASLDGGFSLGQLRARMDGADIVASRSGESWDVAADISAERLSGWTGEIFEGSSIQWSGQVTTGDGFSANGQVDAHDFAYRDFQASRLWGPAGIEKIEGGYRIALNAQTDGMTYPAEVLASALGPDPDLAVAMDWVSEARELRMESLMLDGRSAQLEGRGQVRLNDRNYEFSGDVRARDLSAMADITGQAISRFSLAGDFDGAVSFELDGRASELAGHPAFERLGTDIRFNGSANRSAQGLWVIDRARANGDGLLVRWQASQSDTGDWTADGEAALDAAMDLGPLVLAGGAAAAFDARTEEGVLIWRLDATSPALAAGPLDVENPRVRVEGRGGVDAFTADMRVTADTQYGAVDIGGQIARGEGWRVTGLDGTAGPARLTGDAVFTDADSDAHLVASGRLPNGGDITLNLTAGGEDTLQIDGVLNVEGGTSGRLELTRLQARASGTLDRLDVSVQARGAFDYEWTVTADGAVTNGPDGYRIEINSQGDFGPYALSSTQPLTLRPVEAGQAISAGWTLGPMRVSLQSLFGAERDSIAFEFSDMPADLLSLARSRGRIDGNFSGEVEYRRGQTGLTASAWIEGMGVKPVGGRDAEAINGRADAALTNENFTLTVTASGADLAADARVIIETGNIPSLAAIRDQASAPVRGEADLDGPVGTLARFYLPESQTLVGDLLARAEVGGTVGSPDFSGSANFSDGNFVDIRQGVNVQDLAARGEFSGDGATLESLTGTDGARGTFSGSGRLSFADARPQGSFDVEFRNFNAVDKRDLSVTATGDAHVEVAASGNIHVTGAAVLDNVEARPPESGRANIVEIEVTEINRPESLAPPPEPRSSPITLDYSITAPGRVFVRGPAFESEWELDVTARGPLSAIKLIGDANLLRGSASLVGRPFDLQSGQVSFQGTPSEAEVRIVAQRETEGLTAIVQVSGPVTAPQIALTSQPVLPDDEVLSRVLFGRSVSELSALEAAQLAAALSSAATGGGGFDAFDRLRNLVGVDRLSFRTGASGAPIVTGGRYIDEDVYLEIEAGTGSGEATAARIEWELQPNLRLLSRVTGTADASIALRWRKEYE